MHKLTFQLFINIYSAKFQNMITIEKQVKGFISKTAYNTSHKHKYKIMSSQHI